jgi:hypothetical protein
MNTETKPEISPEITPEVATKTTTKTMTTVTLNTPLMQGAQSITELVLNKPMAGHLRGVKLLDFLQADVDALSMVLPRIVANVSLTPDSVEQLDLVDLVNIQMGLADFFPDTASKAKA